MTNTADHAHADHDGPAAWDERYATSERIWSGNPNGALVAEVEGLAPGTVLDVGCGEGADAVWLARRGWQVTALDVSRVALDRAAEHAREAGVDVTWVEAGLLEAPAGTYDLVSAQYPALRLTPGRVAERALLDAVAPGGTLLVVHHDIPEGHGHEGGFDPADYVSPGHVRELLDDAWAVEVDEKRERHVSTGRGSGHSTDVVLRATRRRA